MRRRPWRGINRRLSLVTSPERERLCVKAFLLLLTNNCHCCQSQMLTCPEHPDAHSVPSLQLLHGPFILFTLGVRSHRDPLRSQFAKRPTKSTKHFLCHSIRSLEVHYKDVSLLRHSGQLSRAGQNREECEEETEEESRQESCNKKLTRERFWGLV